MKKKLVSASIVVAWCFCIGTFVGCGGTPQAESSPPGSSATAAVTVEWSPDVDCVTCHTTEGESFASVATSKAHASQDCMTCHADEGTLAEVHEGVTSESETSRGLSTKSEIPVETCQSCHPAETLQAATESVTTLTDEEGTTVNPHALPDGHLGEKVTCTDCHSVHADETPEKNATKVCTSCHHENVYKCGTCHEV